MPSIVELFVKQGAKVEPDPSSPFKHRSPSKTPLEGFDYTLKRISSREGFEAAFKAQDQKDKEEQERKQAIKRKLLEATQHASILDPDLKAEEKRRRGGRPKTGARTGKALGFKTNKRPLGAQVLRRDPSAAEKLHMVQAIEHAMSKEEVKRIEHLSVAAKRSWEAGGKTPPPKLEDLITGGLITRKEYHKNTMRMP